MVIWWSPKAKRRLKGIYLYYKERSELAAENILTEINSAVEHLTKYPQMAAKEPLLAGFAKIYRSLLVRKYFKVVYFVDEVKYAIVIATVWDSRQNPAKLKLEIEE